jgi:predicted Zn-dependent protease
VHHQRNNQCIPLHLDDLVQQLVRQLVQRLVARSNQGMQNT